MCMGRMLLQPENLLNIIKQADPDFAKRFDAQEANKKSSATPSTPSKAAMPKQKRRIRPSRLMRSGGGNRSFLEGGQ